jgi:hypothetical protein
MTIETGSKTEQIMIPGKPEMVDKARVHGDIGGEIRSELSGNESFFNQLPDCEKLKEIIDHGGRVFITESDDYLIVDPEKES